MSTKTKNLNLIKPEENDYVNIKDINNNMDIIDEKLATESKKIDGMLSGTASSVEIVTVQSGTIRNNSASDLTFKISSKDNETLKSIKDKSPTVINANVIAKALDGVAINGKGIPSSYNVESTNDEYVITVYSGSSSVVGQYLFAAVVTIAYERDINDIRLAELKNMCIGEDGTVYDNAGDALRGQIGQLKESLDKSLDGIVNRSIILRDNEKHEFPLPKGTKVKLETLDGSNFEITPDAWRFFRLYGSDGSELSHFGTTEGTSQRTLSVDVDGVTKIGLYKKHTVPVYVSVLSESNLMNEVASLKYECKNTNDDIIRLDKSLDGIVNRSIILRDNEKHEFPLPKGTKVKLETLDGSNFEITPDAWRFFRLYGSDGSELSHFGTTEGTSQRTLSVDVDGVTKIGLYKKHTVPVYVSVLSESNHKKYQIDNYLNEEYLQTFDEINEKKTEDSITIGIMTDLHFSSRGSGYNEQLLRDGVIFSMKALSNMTRDVKHDVVSFLGDYEQFPTEKNKQAKQMGFDNLLEINDFLSKMNCKAIAIQGNHERLYSGIDDSYGMTDDEFFRYCTEQFVYKNGFITDGIHCYYDDVKNKLRYIFLNSTTNSIDAFVVEFLKRASNTTYDVVVLSHFGGESGTIYDSTKKYIDTLKENGANVILWLSGHCHQDWHYEYNDCLIISFLQSGYWSSEVSENGVRYEHETGNKNYCAFTTVLLNRTEKKVHCIRFGLGINYTYNLPNAS